MKFEIRFSPIEYSICHILGMVDPIDVKQKWNESTRCYADSDIFDLDLWPWIFKVKLYLGNGRPNCHRTKGMGINRMPWWETQPLCDLEAEDIVRDRGDVRCQSFRWLVWLYNSIETLLYNCGISGKHWNGQIEHLIDIIRYISCILYSKLSLRGLWLSKMIFFVH